MLNYVKSALKNSLIYSTGNISIKLIGIILVPLYTKHLSLQEYGVLSLLEVTAQVLIALWGLNLYSALFRWYWDKNYLERQQAMFFTVLLTLVFSGMIMVGGVIGIADKLSGLLLGTEIYAGVIRLMALAAGLQILMELVTGLMRIQERALLYALTTILKFVTDLSFTVFFIVKLQLGIAGIYKAQIIGYLVYFLAVSGYLLKNIQWRLELRILVEMLKFSLPLMLSSVASVLLNVADRFCLKVFGQLAFVGLYSLGFKIANTLNVLVVRSANLAISPMIYKMMDAPGNKRFYAKVMTYLGYGTVLCALALSVYSLEIVKVLAKNQEYWAAYRVIPLIALAIVFGSLKDSALSGLNIKKKSSIIAAIIALCSMLNVILNGLFIHFFNYLGAAIAGLVTQFLFFLLIYRNAQKHYPIPYEITKIFKMIGVAIICYIVASWTNHLATLYRVILKSGIIAVFPFLLFLLNFYEPVELTVIKGAWRKWHNPLNWKKNLSKIKFSDKQ